MRQDVLNYIHESHLAVWRDESQRHVELSSIYWPIMSAAIERLNDC